MADTLIDIYNRILKYDGETVYIAFDTKSGDPYFHANQVCEIMKYERPIKALQKMCLLEIYFI